MTATAGTETKITSGQAAYVLDRLIAERRVTRTDVNRYIAEMGREISDLERRLTALREAHGGTIAAVAATVAAGAAAAVTYARRKGPGRPPGRPAASATVSTGSASTGATTGRRPGRPVGSGRKPGRPAANTAVMTMGGGAGATDTGTTGTTGATAPMGGAKRGRKASAAITEGQLASRQLQGRYLALVRQVPENKRAQFARTAKEKGREAAIQEMQTFLKK
jgi:hypothetical protein